MQSPRGEQLTMNGTWSVGLCCPQGLRRTLRNINKSAAQMTNNRQELVMNYENYV